MKKIGKKILIIVLLSICIMGVNTCKAKSKDTALTQIQKYLNIDAKNITEEQLLDLYNEFTEKYTKEELLKMLEENQEELTSKGISDTVIEAGKTILQTTNEEDIKRIIEENIDIKDVQEKINNGSTTEEIVESIIDEIPTTQKLEIIVDLFFSNIIVKTVIALTIILFIYRTILRAVIYHKAGRRAIAAFIPFYRQFTMYDICGLSYGYMVLWLIPIVGWLCLCFIAIMKRIYLAKNFGRNIGFGLGLIVFPSIFQSILAFNKNIQYISENGLEE